MAEKSLWSYLRKGMMGKWEHARRHEDSISLGTSDVSYYHAGNSWIELKEVKKLPARAATGISLGQWHENDGAQRHFLIKRKGWLFVRVNYPQRMYLLFDHKHLPPWEKNKRLNWIEFSRSCYFIWHNRIDFEQLANILERPE